MKTVLAREQEAMKQRWAKRKHKRKAQYPRSGDQRPQYKFCNSGNAAWQALGTHRR